MTQVSVYWLEFDSNSSIYPLFGTFLNSGNTYYGSTVVRYVYYPSRVLLAIPVRYIQHDASSRISIYDSTTRSPSFSNIKVAGLYDNIRPPYLFVRLTSISVSPELRLFTITPRVSTISLPSQKDISRYDSLRYYLLANSVVRTLQAIKLAISTSFSNTKAPNILLATTKPVSSFSRIETQQMVSTVRNYSFNRS